MKMKDELFLSSATLKMLLWSERATTCIIKTVHNPNSSRQLRSIVQTIGRQKLNVYGKDRSHACTVVRESCKDDDDSQWEMGKYDPRHPKTPSPMVTAICVGNCVGDIYHQAKFYPNQFRGFSSAHAWFRAARHQVTRLFLGGWKRRQPRRARRFWRKIRQTTRFRTRKCLLGVAKPKSKISPPHFHPKPPFLGPISTGLRIFFARKRL